MSYPYVHETAGATVHCYEEFGAYHGDWLAKVTYKNQTGWIHSYFGSCTGCDAFLNEFGYEDHVCGDNKYYDPIENSFIEDCPKCQEIKARLIRFGQDYLETVQSYEDVLEEISENIEWDYDVKEMVQFLKDNK